KLESADRDRYLRKRRSFISGGANLVEIDLVRQGSWVFPRGIRNVLERAGEMARALLAVHRDLRLSRSECAVAVLRGGFRAARLLSRRCLEPVGAPPQRPMDGARPSSHPGGMFRGN